jgi:hypothetical protein
MKGLGCTLQVTAWESVSVCMNSLVADDTKRLGGSDLAAGVFARMAGRAHLGWTG